jgi:signal transduction histidine kinase
MRLEYSLQRRAERLIATGRLILVAFSLLGVWADPTVAARPGGLLERLLFAYGAYAALLAAAEWSLPAPLLRLRPLTHAFDLGVFALLTTLGEGPASFSLVYFVFALVSATLRWQWRGTLWTASAALAILLGLGLYVGGVLRDPAFDLRHLAIQGLSLAVLAAMLGYMGAYEGRARRDMARLSTWPRAVPREVEALARELLEHAAAVVGGRRVVVAWDEPEEPWRHLAWLAGGELLMRREQATGPEGLVAGPLAGSSFICRRVHGPAPLVLHTTGGGLARWHGPPLGRALQSRFAPTSALALRVPGETVNGWLFAFDKPDLVSDDLTLGEIVARQTAARLDHFYLAQRLQEAAAGEERIRLARDLHDGLAQTLAGAALQLEYVATLVDAAPALARDRLREIQRIVAAEQRDLRTFIRHLRPGPLGSSRAVTLAARLTELRTRVAREWGVRVELAGDDVVERLPEALAHEAFRLVQEGLMNAARHAHATLIRIRLDAEPDRLRVTVEDDGLGLGFQGRRDLAALERERVGPRTLRERVATLGGDLIIDSTGRGTRLDIRLPLRRTGA